MSPVAGWFDANLIAIINGIAFGLLLYTVSVGLSLILGAMNVLNLAHGIFYLVGMVNGFIGTTFLIRRVEREGRTAISTSLATSSPRMHRGSAGSTFFPMRRGVGASAGSSAIAWRPRGRGRPSRCSLRMDRTGIR